MTGATGGQCTAKKLLLAASLAPLLLAAHTGLVQANPAQQSQIHSAAESEIALLNAVKLGKTERARSLLHQGTDPNAKTDDERQRSVLIIATIGGDTGLVNLLLASGAAVDQQDGDGLTALNWAALRSQTAIARILLDHQAQVNLGDNQQVTPLLYSIGTGNRELTNLLLARGANPNVESVANKMTPLLLAIENRDSVTVELLLDKGAAVNGANSDNYSPLMAAAEVGDLQISKLLLSRGAHPGLRDHKGRTAAVFAQRGGHQAITELLGHDSGQ